MWTFRVSGKLTCKRWEGHMQPVLEFTPRVDAVVAPLIARNPGKNPQGPVHNHIISIPLTTWLTQAQKPQTKKALSTFQKKTDSIFTKLMFLGFFSHLLTDEFRILSLFTSHVVLFSSIQVLSGAQRGVFSHPLTPAELLESKENVSKQRSVANIFFKKRPQRQKMRR